MAKEYPFVDEYNEASAPSQKTKPAPAYPADHQVGMKVPKGGSDCAKCEYVSKDGKECGNKGFVMWNGSRKLPEPANEYCCDFFEPK